jgi:hypothetical protein
MPRTAFVKTLKTALGLECEDGQLVNKLQMMESKYKSVKIECGRTGEGLTEGTMEFVSWEGKYRSRLKLIYFYSNTSIRILGLFIAGYVRAKCHFFFLLDAVMKTRVNINPPFEFNTTGSIVIDISENGYNPVMEDEAVDRQMEHELFGIDSQAESPKPAPKIKKDAGQYKHDVEKKKVTQKLEKGGGSSISEALKLQAKITGLHYQQINECKKIEASNNTEKLQIEKDRLQFEETRENAKLKLEEQKLAQTYELEKMKFEREKEKETNEITILRLQIELEKLKKGN